MLAHQDGRRGLFGVAFSLATVLALAGSARAQAPAVEPAPGSSPAPGAPPAAAAVSSPRFIEGWHDGDPIPLGYHRAERVRKGEITAGALLFGVPYIFLSVEPSTRKEAGYWGSDVIWIPVLGPFLKLNGTSSAGLDCFLVVDGLVQGIGAALAIHGFTTPRPTLLRNDLAMVTVTATPMGKDGTGVVLLGRF
jgi:hypothetical protein